MPLPDTFITLQLAGYRPAGAGTCKRCSAHVEWFWTPKNCKMPFSLKCDVMITPEGTAYLKPSLSKLEPHFAACPDVERSRRKKR